MDTASELLLLLLAIVVFNAARDTDHGGIAGWFKAKFLNAADPTPREGLLTRWFGEDISAARTEAGNAVIAGARPLLAPADGPIVSGFGPRKSPGGIGSTNHKGIDIGAPNGAPVRAAAAGKVVAVGSAGGYGLRVDIDHGHGLVTRYAHLRRITVDRGQQVGAGATLGEVGSTGTATGPHLHFEVRVNGVAVDPAPWLAGQLTGASS